MSRNPLQKRRVHGRKEALFQGLAAEVQDILNSLYNVGSVSCAGVRRYHGEPKVRIPERWSRGRILIEVCDGDFGERKMCINTPKPGAIARILKKKLEARGRAVC